MKYTDRFIFGLVVAIAATFSLNAQACSLAAWSDSSGAVSALSPPPNANTRFQQFCGLAVDGTGYVQDNSPIDDTDTRIRLQFYVIADAGNDEVVILQAFEDDAGASEAFSISHKPSTGELGFTTAGNATVYAAMPQPERWTQVQIDWDAAGGLRYWIDATPNQADDNPTGTIDEGTATNIGMVRLGAPVAFGDATRFSFDSYQANRTTAIPGLLIGDANASGGISISDVTNVSNELRGTLASGQPDCNLNGAVTVSDITCIAGKL